MAFQPDVYEHINIIISHLHFNHLFVCRPDSKFDAWKVSSISLVFDLTKVFFVVYFFGDNFEAIFLFTTLFAIVVVVAVMAYNFSICGWGILVEIIKEILQCVVYMYLCGWSRLSITFLSVLGGAQMICKYFFLPKMDQGYLPPNGTMFYFSMFPSIIGASVIPWIFSFASPDSPFSEKYFQCITAVQLVINMTLISRLYDLPKNSITTTKMMPYLIATYNFCTLFYVMCYVCISYTIAIQNLNNEKNSKIDNGLYIFPILLFLVFSVMFTLYWLWYQFWFN